MAQKHQWSRLTKQQVGRYAEYYVKMEFTLHGFDVYSAEVDDKGIDFVIRKEPGRYYDVQVKSVRKLGYIFLPKDKFMLSDNLLAVVVLLFEHQEPCLYLIPATAWLEPNALLTGHDYGEGMKSKPEWGLNLSQQNMPLLEQYAFEAGVDLL